MDVSEFYDTFFEEAEELLGDMEQQLLDLDPAHPDIEQLNAIFRAAHSIKGGAGTFGFTVLQHTTHILENLLDDARRGHLALTRAHVDLFLETKDVLHDQLQAHRDGAEPDAAVHERICAALSQVADVHADPAAAAVPTPPRADTASTAAANSHFRVELIDVDEKDRELLVAELAHLGTVTSRGDEAGHHVVMLASTESAADIEAVMCFIAEPEQLRIQPAPAPTPVPVPAPPPAEAAAAAPRARKGQAESSLRVPVGKVDHIINLVGELIITQSMLNQVADRVDGAAGADLRAGLGLLERNARDLQEAVMSVRMVPMDYVFSRFPRLVRDLAGKLDKAIELVTEGRATELDKSLTERIIDPLTHLVRNSLDHGIEHPAEREAVGKPRTGVLTLSAEHQGGNIVIEVRDDGAGLDRQRILAKARERQLKVSDAMPDDEVWQLIFAPGFSTAAEVSDVSGRGVGMDVVKRNIEAMGGHVEVLSEPGAGTTTRIMLPLTLAILDGMSVRVGNETYIVPVSAVMESLQPGASDLYPMAGDDVLLKVREDYLPLVALHEVMDIAGAQADPQRAIAVVVQARGRRYALLVDELLGQQQVVVKNLETNYRKVAGISAATIMGDGSVALILDVNGLQQMTRTRQAPDARAGASRPHEHHKETDLS